MKGTTVWTSIETISNVVSCNNSGLSKIFVNESYSFIVFYGFFILSLLCFCQVTKEKRHFWLLISNYWENHFLYFNLKFLCLVNLVSFIFCLIGCFQVLPQFVFNSRDPIVMGVIVEAGIVKEGTPICVPSKNVSTSILRQYNSNHVRCTYNRNA